MFIRQAFISLALFTTVLTPTVDAKGELSKYSLEEEVEMLVGLRYMINRNDRSISADLTCIYLGGGMLGNSTDGKRVGTISLECQGRRVIAIDVVDEVIDERILGYRITDALLLPPMKDWSADPDELVDISSEFCEVDGEDGYPNYKILGRWSGREMISGRDGLEYAWLLDYEQTGQIIPVDINRFVCYRIEP